MQTTFKLRKLAVDLGPPVSYTAEPAALAFNPLIGKRLSLRHTGGIYCRVCDKKIPKAYGEGYCYPHFESDPGNSPCIIRPELCQAHEGIGRDPEWEKRNHACAHIVYLAVSSGLKVGVTRADNATTRWIDQGAAQAIVLAEVPYRALAGEIEVALKEHLSDRTSWQKMLKNEQAQEIDLIAEKTRVATLLPTALQEYVSRDAQIAEIEYPVTQWPTKVKSINLDKLPEYSGMLTGIRGQYLMFEDGHVFNMRRHTGYEVEFTSE